MNNDCDQSYKPTKGTVICHILQKGTIQTAETMKMALCRPFYNGFETAKSNYLPSELPRLPKKKMSK